jgi:hypothetical protein
MLLFQSLVAHRSQAGSAESVPPPSPSPPYTLTSRTDNVIHYRLRLVKCHHPSCSERRVKHRIRRLYSGRNAANQARIGKLSNRRPASPVDAFVMSFRCCGRRPSRPPADPGTKDLTTARISDSSKHRVDGGGIGESDIERTGCLIHKAFAVTSSNGVIRITSSSILLDTLAARSLGCRRRCDGFC